ncbi:hypothetical protein [Prevotella pallens]|uniref:hypothetical protein n=1 Tax=Prevotella pallens TaxID=60133 RepID=UPI001CAF54B9|nr:hypothetical protein [Prevotella pallens]MBF1502810.1 hypothetical protein [Prevotella pallens]
MELDKTIRENLDGDYLTIHVENFKEGVEYAAQKKLQQIHLIGGRAKNVIVDFKELNKLSETLQDISFIQDIGNVINFESIYNLKEMRKIYIHDKQKFTFDVSRFTKLQHLGGDYWNGLINLDKAYSLTSLVICKYPFPNLVQFSALRNLEILHIYGSKIQNLDGVEKLSIRELSLARNNKLEDIHKINEVSSLENLEIECCKKLLDFSFLKGNSYIEDLFIDKLDSIDFVESMPNLKKINFWNCKDGNMTPLLKSQSLEDVNFYPNKRHYTHTLKEIEEIRQKKDK